MNLYGIIILAALLLDYILNLAADLLNLKAMRRELPEEFQGVYDPEAYRKSQEYLRVKTRFGILTATVGLIALLAFWFSGGFNLIDQWARSGGVGPIMTGLAYIGILVFLRGLLSLPFQIYDTFVIEERFGFNKMTPATFVADLIKGTVLGLLLGGPLLAGILFFFHFAGELAWLYAWAAFTLFVFFVQFIAPTWIMPIFNKFTPLGEGELKERILSYARSVDFPVEQIYVIDGSRRSTKANAFFSGFGRHKRIALFDTLIAKQTVPELVAILAHEIGHYKKKHILLGMALSIAHAGLIFFLLSIFLYRPGLYEAFYMEQPSIYAGLVFFSLLFTPVESILSIFLQALSRRNEYEADRFAAETFEQPEAMIGALKKLAVDHLSNLTPHPLHVILNDSHPPILQRIQAIRQAEREHPHPRRSTPQSQTS
ncbi:MAG: M48 family metallopeptidase [Candidatus Manganitrophus sp. SA1]|nr:M48 family metallopeptidase [Candidatus Manganitrophus morganii]